MGLDVTVIYVVVVIIMVVFRFSAIAVAAVPAQALPPVSRVLPLGLVSSLQRVPLVLPGSSLASSENPSGSSRQFSGYLVSCISLSFPQGS